MDILKNYSIFNFKMIIIIILLFKVRFYKYLTLNNKMKISLNLLFFNKYYLCSLNDIKNNFFILKLGLKNGNIILKKFIKELKKKNLNFILIDKLYKKFKNNTSNLSNKFHFNPYIKLLFKHNFIKKSQILFYKKFYFCKKININFIIHKMYISILSNRKYNNKVCENKKFVEFKTKSIFNDYKQKKVFVYKIKNLFNFVKKNNLFFELRELIINEQKISKIYFKFNRYIYFIKKCKNFKKIYFNSMFRFYLFEKLFKKIIQCHQKTIHFWKLKFKINSKFKNYNFDICIFHLFVWFICQRKIYCRIDIILSHFQITTQTKPNLNNTFHYTILTKKFSLTNWNILF